MKIPYPANTKAFWMGLLVGCLLGAATQWVMGCAAKPDPKPFPPADWRLEGMSPGVTYYKKPDGTLVGCARGPEVVK